METATGPGAECAHVTVFWSMKSCRQTSPRDRSENNKKSYFHCTVIITISIVITLFTNHFCSIYFGGSNRITTSRVYFNNFSPLILVFGSDPIAWNSSVSTLNPCQPLYFFKARLDKSIIKFQLNNLMPRIFKHLEAGCIRHWSQHCPWFPASFLWHFCYQNNLTMFT